MRDLKRYELDFELTMKYLRQNLEMANILSSNLLNGVHFREGCFFTLLTQDSNIDRIYEFESGVVLPQNPEQEYFIAGEKATYSEIPVMHEEISSFILHQTQDNQKLSCVFDDILRSPDSPFLDEFYGHQLLYTHKDEIYYVVTKNNADARTILNCIRQSNAIWHSLCVLTITNFTHLNSHELSLEKIKDICMNTQLIIVGAYDGEGYVFWEKSK